MKRIKKALAMVLALAMAICCFSIASYAYEQPQQENNVNIMQISPRYRQMGRVKVMGLNLRSSASTSASIGGTLKLGDTVEFLSNDYQYADNITWAYVVVRSAQDSDNVGLKGYVDISCLSLYEA